MYPHLIRWNESMKTISKNNSDLFQSDIFGNEPIAKLKKFKVGDVVRFELPVTTESGYEVIPGQSWDVRIDSIARNTFGEYKGRTEYYFTPPKWLRTVLFVRSTGEKSEFTDVDDLEELAWGYFSTSNHQDFTYLVFLNNDDCDCIGGIIDPEVV
jgi:hypothetical protein